MAAGNTVQLVFAGDSKSLEKTFSNVGAGAKGMAADLDKTEGDVRKFGSGVDNMNDKIGNSESKFMGAADLLDGLGGAFGLPLGEATNMARSFADLAGGLSSVVGPAIGKVLGMLGLQTAATAAQTTATGTATVAQGGLNAMLLANPIGAVVVAIGLLVAAFVLAWKHSETFREIVRGAMAGVSDAVGLVVGAVKGAFNWVKDNWPLILAILTGPFGLAVLVVQRNFDTIIGAFKGAWNAIARIINGVDITIPAIDLPGPLGKIGGMTIGLPDLPTFHGGGVVPGLFGTAVPIMALAGETVTPPGRGGGMVVNLYVSSFDPATAGPLVVRALDEYEARNGARYARA